MDDRSSKADENCHFQHYTLKHQVVSWVSRRLFDNHTYTVRHGLMRGLKRRGGLGWVPAILARSIETPEYEFWQKFPLTGLTVYDVGSFEGLLAVFFASRAKQVICYEPNSRNHARLLANIQLNGFQNLTVRKLGAGEAPEERQLVWNPAMPGGASVEAATADHLKESGSEARIESISITTLDRDAAEMRLPPPDLIKIDIEGWELQALRGGRGLIEKYHPALYLEMHGETMADKKRKSADLVAFLEAAGYPVIEHVETGQRITHGNSDLAAEGHLYCPRF